MTISIEAGSERLNDYGDYVAAIADVRAAAARANAELGLLTAEKADAAAKAADSVKAAGLAAEENLRWMGAAGRPALDAVTAAMVRVSEGALTADDLTINQAVTDVVTTASEAAVTAALKKVENAAVIIADAFAAKAREFADLVKCGRVTLQDAEPVRLGEEFAANAAAIREAADAVVSECARWNRSHLGAGNLGTGIGVTQGFSAAAARALSERLGRPIEGDTTPMGGMMLSVRYLRAHGALEALAFAVWKASHDFEFEASGPRGGIREIALPAVAPGSSIMPGKINPTVAELAMAICNHVLASREALMQGMHRSWTGPGPVSGLPVRALMQSANLLSRVCLVLVDKVITGITPNDERARRAADRSVALGLALVPVFGRDTARSVMEEAFKNGLTVREVVVRRGLLSKEEAEKTLSPERLSVRDC